MTVPQTRTDLLAARKAAAGLGHFSGYAGAVAGAGFAATGAADAEGATAAGDALAAISGNAPISWHTAPRSRNLVALVVTPAA